MTPKLTDKDLPLLHSAGFEPGWSGASWFKADKQGGKWQVFLDDDSKELWFLPPQRVSKPLSRAEFDHLFVS